MGEARFAAIVASIGHPIKEAECKGYKGAEKRFTIGSQSKSCTKCVSGGTGYTCAKEINKSNWAGSDTYSDRFQVSYSGDKICVKRVDAKGLNCHGWGMNLRFNCHQGIQTSATAMPCNMKVCNQICTEKKSSLDFHKYSIGYDVMECVDDTACINANNKCRATLMGVMKAAQDAEVSLKGAAEDEFKAAETAAAAAKASKVSSQKASSAADSKLEAQVKAYDAAKKSHLESQAAYHGAKSKAAEALKKYNEAVKKHCDYESLHTKLVKQINHGHLATNECGKEAIEEELLTEIEEFDELKDDALMDVDEEEESDSQGSWKFAKQIADRAKAAKATAAKVRAAFKAAAARAKALHAKARAAVAKAAAAAKKAKAPAAPKPALKGGR